MGCSPRVMLCFPWVSRGPQPSRPLSAPKKVCSRRAKKEGREGTCECAVSLCAILWMNLVVMISHSSRCHLAHSSYGCHIRRAVVGGCGNDTKQRHPSKSRGQMPFFGGGKLLEKLSVSHAFPQNTSIASHLHTHAHRALMLIHSEESLIVFFSPLSLNRALMCRFHQHSGGMQYGAAARFGNMNVD